MPIGAAIVMNNASGVAQSTADLVQSLVQAALTTWSQMLAGATSINVRISIVDSLPSGRAQGGNETGIFAGTSTGFNIFEPGTAYELRTGLQHSLTTPDIHIQIARDYLINELFLDTTLATSNDIPQNRTDGYSVFLHEIGHALGFIGYYNEASDTFFSNANTPYDTRLIRNGGGDVRYDGPNVRAVYGSSVPLTNMNYAHYGNTNAYPGTSTDPLTGLMNGVVYYRGYRYGISSLDLAFMADMGVGTVNNDVFDQSYFHTFTGGLGNDTYHVYAQSDVVREFANEGNDTVIAHSNYVLSANIENLTLAGTADIDGAGNAGNNVITGNAGSNRLSGGGGTDTLIGGAGDDFYVVDSADDVVVETAGQGYDTLKASVSYTLGAGVSIENLRLIGSDNLSITGNADAQVVVGNAGDNVLDGGGGGDRLKGGYGNDTYIIRDAADVVVEVSDSGTNDVVKAAVSYTLGVNAWAEVLRTIDDVATTAINLTGNDHTLTITGNAGANVLTGGAGAETIAGLGGNDTLYGGGGADVFVFASGTGADTVGDFVSGSDRIDLSAAGFTSFAQVQAAMSDVGGSAVIALGGGSSVTLTGVLGSQVQSGDVIVGSGGASVFVQDAGVGIGIAGWGGGGGGDGATVDGAPAMHLLLNEFVIA